MATTVINVSPCNPNGKPLNEEFFVEDPSELLGKPYHFKVRLGTNEILQTRVLTIRHYLKISSLRSCKPLFKTFYLFSRSPPPPHKKS